MEAQEQAFSDFDRYDYDVRSNHQYCHHHLFCFFCDDNCHRSFSTFDLNIQQKNKYQIQRIVTK